MKVTFTTFVSSLALAACQWNQVLVRGESVHLRGLTTPDDGPLEEEEQDEDLLLQRDLQLSGLLNQGDKVIQEFYDTFTEPEKWGTFTLKIHMYDKMKEEKAFWFCFETDDDGHVDVTSKTKIASRTFEIDEDKPKYSDAHSITITKDNCPSGIWMVRFKALIDGKWTILRPDESTPRGFKTPKKYGAGIVEYLPSGMFTKYDYLCTSSHDWGYHWDSEDFLDTLTKPDEHYTLIYMNEPTCGKWEAKMKDKWIADNM